MFVNFLFEINRFILLFAIITFKIFITHEYLKWLIALTVSFSVTLRLPFCSNNLASVKAL